MFISGRFAGFEENCKILSGCLPAMSVKCPHFSQRTGKRNDGPMLFTEVWLLNHSKTQKGTCYTKLVIKQLAVCCPCPDTEQTLIKAPSIMAYSQNKNQPWYNCTENMTLLIDCLEWNNNSCFVFNKTQYPCGTYWDNTLLLCMYLAWESNRELRYFVCCKTLVSAR